MAGYTRDDALAFVDSLRIVIGNRTGFKWMAEKLCHLSEYIESVSAENERLNAYVDRAGLRAEYEAHRSTAEGDAGANTDEQD